MSNLFIQETWHDLKQQCCYGDSGVFETFTDNAGELFRALQKYNGRCTGKVYTEKGGKTVHIGWIFERLDRYQDTREPFLRETWVTVHGTLVR